MSLWAYIAVGGGLVGGALLLRKSKEAAPPAPSSSTNPCDRLKAAGAPQYAVDACNAARTIAGGLGALVDMLPNTDQDNIAINGPVTKRIHGAAQLALHREMGANSADYGPVTAPGTLEYQNGCVPIPGHPGWSKCAPGTKSMVNEPWWRTSSGYATGYGAGKSPAAMGSGDPDRDVLTFKWPGPIAHSDTRNERRRPIAFPLDGAGERWIVRGQPVVCAAGTTVNSGRDHRTGVTAPICAPPRTVVTPPPVTPTYTPGTRDPNNPRDRRTDPPR